MGWRQTSGGRICDRHTLETRNDGEYTHHLEEESWDSEDFRTHLAHSVAIRPPLARCSGFLRCCSLCHQLGKSQQCRVAGVAFHFENIPFVVVESLPCLGAEVAVGN